MCCSEASPKSLTNNKLALKNPQRTNALAYFATASVTKKKTSFMTLRPVLLRGIVHGKLGLLTEVAGKANHDEVFLEKGRNTLRKVR
jgi:hypothetical protein